MAHLSLAELRSLRESKKTAMELRDYLNKNAHISIAMGTVGIASGAKKTLEAFSDLLIKEKITNIALVQAPNRGTQGFDPMVEVTIPGMETVVYQRVDAQKAKLIIEKHVKGKQILTEHVYKTPRE